MKKQIIYIISFIFCLITIFAVLSNQTIQVNYDVNVAAAGGIMSTGNPDFNPNTVISVKNFIITIVFIVIVFFLLCSFFSLFKAWDEKCYKEDPTAIPKSEQKSSTGETIIIVIVFVFLTIASQGGFIILALISAPIILITNLIINFIFKILDLKSAAAKNLISRFFEFAIVIGIIVIMALMAAPRPHGSRAQARQKACYSNMRVINSAIEMYNMDVTGSEMMDTLDLGKLTSTGYLKAAPTCPETGKSSSYTGTNLTTTGQIHCEYTYGEFSDLKHGYLDLPDQ